VTRVLALDAACARCSAAVTVDGLVRAEQHSDTARGHAALLPEMVRHVLSAAGLSGPDLDLIAVTVGPGSFTGLRTSLALAQGLALASHVTLVGVSVGETFAEALPQIGRRSLWTAIDSRRGRVFLERGSSIVAVSLDDLPRAPGPIAVAGDAAIAVASRLAARDSDVMLTNVRLPLAWQVAAAAVRRHASALPPRDVLPIYVDPPEARRPAAGLRPAPRGV